MVKKNVGKKIKQDFKNEVMSEQDYEAWAGLGVVFFFLILFLYKETRRQAAGKVKTF